MNSKLYVGRVRHRRFIPREHVFSYTMFMMYLDLDELPHLFDRFWLWSARGPNLARFRREDHLGNRTKPLKQAVYELVLQDTGMKLNGNMYLLTHLRYFGHGFNPVSFYYCYDAGQVLRAIVVEVNNTPWGEQHCYVLPIDARLSDLRHHNFSLDKAFHVSPFNPMNQRYRWILRTPGKHLTVHMENWQDDLKYFDASLLLNARDISSASLAGALARFPLMTIKVVGAIYWEALKLWFKKIPLYDHPENGTAEKSQTHRGRST